MTEPDERIEESVELRPLCSGVSVTAEATPGESHPPWPGFRPS